MAYGMQVFDRATKQWNWVHPSNPAKPYRYATEKEASDMLRICYPMETNKSVRVHPFDDVVPKKALTIDEKITIKGKLARYGVPACTLVRLNLDCAKYMLWKCAHISIADYAKLK
jgi:hypothetical protein